MDSEHAAEAQQQRSRTIAKILSRRIKSQRRGLQVDRAPQPRSKKRAYGNQPVFLHSRMLASWGISEFSKKEYDESIEEMKHADSLIQRILFLGGLPNLQDTDKLLIGEGIEEVIEGDLRLEEKAMADLREAIAHAEQARDYAPVWPMRAFSRAAKSTSII